MRPGKFLLLNLALAFSLPLFSQSGLDSILSKIDAAQWSHAIEKKIRKIEERLITKSRQSLDRLQREEEKIYNKQIHSKDSALAKAKLEEIRVKYAQLKERMMHAAAGSNHTSQYIPRLDSLITSLKFLGGHSTNEKIQLALSRVQSLQATMQQAGEIKNFLGERLEALKQQLGQAVTIKDLAKYNKELFYYSEQLKEYRNILSDPDKIEKKVIALLCRLPEVQKFINENLSARGLFASTTPGLPLASLGGPATFNGLQSRIAVQQVMQQRVGPNIQNVQNKFRESLSAYNEFKSKIESAGTKKAEGFKPNHQRVKRFKDRLTYNFNIQFSKASNFFPSMGNLGFNVGYRMTDELTSGVGIGYKLGLGHGWEQIRITQEGLSIRSFIEHKLSRGFYGKGGFEYNYNYSFKNISALKDAAKWQRSALLGISKRIQLGNSISGEMLIMYDFLYRDHFPVSSPFIYRFGYNF